MKNNRRRKLIALLVSICMLSCMANPIANAENIEKLDVQTLGGNELQSEVINYYVGGGTGAASGTIGTSSENPFTTLYDAIQTVNQKPGNYNIIIQGNTTEDKAIKIGDGVNVYNVTISNLDAGSENAASGSALLADAASSSAVNSGMEFKITNAIEGDYLISINNNTTLTLNGTASAIAGLTFEGSSNATQAMFHVEAQGTLNLHSGVSIENNTNISSMTTFRECGGVYNEGCFLMDGGKISGNGSTCYGGVCNEGKLILTDGSITGNSGNRCGGVYNVGTFDMSGGSILNNTSSMASGVDNSYNGIFRMTAGTIESSDTGAYAGIYSASSFTISGNVTIGGTGASKYVYLYKSSFITIGGNLTCENNISLMLDNYSPGRQVFGGDAAFIKNNYSKFSLDAYQTKYSITDTGILEYHGVIKTYYVDAIAGNDNNAGTSEAPFATIQKAVNAIDLNGKVGTIYICSDLILTAPVNIWGTVTIRNKGEKHTISRGGTFQDRMFNVWDTLILGDSEKDGVDDSINLVLDGNHLKVNSGIVLNEGILELHNGVSLQNSASYSFGGVENECNFTMYGGSIMNNTVYDGGVYNLSTGIFTMKGGSINNNSAIVGGGVRNAGKFIMEGGTISNNTASNYGNGIFCEAGTFSLKKDAVISGNDVAVNKDNKNNMIIIAGSLSKTVPGVTVTVIHEYEKSYCTGDQIIASGDGYHFTPEDLAKISLSDTQYFLDSTGAVNARLQDDNITIKSNSGFYYTGKEIKPPISVYVDRELTEGTDYQVSYENNNNAGTALIYVDGIGNYTGHITKKFTIQKAVIQNINTAVPKSQIFKASQGKSEEQLLSTITMANVNASYPDGTVNLPVTWKLTSGSYNPKGGVYTYTGTLTGNNNIDTGNAKLTTKITVTESVLNKPSFDNILITNGTDTKASAKALGSSVLPTSGSILEDGRKVNYTIIWDNQTIDTTISGASTTFTGTVNYTDAPDWATLPSDLAVKRTVSIEPFFIITASAGSYGSITPSGNIIVKSNADRSFTFTPAEGYYISDVLVDGSSVGAVNSYTFKHVLKNHKLIVLFKKDSIEPATIVSTQPKPTSAPVIIPSEGKANVIQADVSVKVEQDEVGEELNTSITVNNIPGVGDMSQQSEVIIPISSDELTQKLKNSGKQKANINVTIPDSLLKNDKIADCDIQLATDVIKAAKDTEKDITVSVKSEQGKEMYSWTFNGSQLAASDKQVKDINLSIDIERAGNDKKVSKLLSQGESSNEISNSLIINFRYHGDLPSQADVKIYVGDIGFTEGQTLYLYYYNSDTGKLVSLPYSSYKVDSYGFVTVSIIHCSEYILMPKKADNSIITSLLNQIRVTSKTITLYSGKMYNSKAMIKIKLPDTLELVKAFRDKTSGSAVGAAVLSYRTSNSKVAVVSSTGEVTAKDVGNAVITVTVTLYSGNTRKFKVKVIVKKPDKNTVK